MIATRRVVVPELGPRPRLLVPVLKGQNAPAIISVGDALLATPDASGSVLALVELRGPGAGVVTQEARRRDLLQWLAGLEYGREVRRRLKITVRVSADVVRSVREAIAETAATRLVVEWPTVTSPRRHRLAVLARGLLAEHTLDTLFVRPAPGQAQAPIAPRSIVAALRGGLGARAVAATAAALADAYGSRLTLLHVQSDGEHPDRSRREVETFEAIAAGLHSPPAALRVRHAESAATAILEEAAQHDLVMIGSRLDATRPDELVSRSLMRKVRNVSGAVIMLRPKQASTPVAGVEAAAVGRDA